MSKIIDNPFPTKYPGIMVVITAKKKGNKWYLSLKNRRYGIPVKKRIFRAGGDLSYDDRTGMRYTGR